LYVYVTAGPVAAPRGRLLLRCVPRRWP